jgi:hypothetical protein
MPDDTKSSDNTESSDDTRSADSSEGSESSGDNGDRKSSNKRLIIEIAVAATGFATLLVNGYFSYQSYQNAKKTAAIEERQYEDKIFLQYSLSFTGSIDSKIVPYSGDSSKQVAKVDLAAQNTGERTLKGCLTMYEFVKDDLQPDIYYPWVGEGRVRFWQLKGGENHESAIEALLPPADLRQKVLIEFWYQCENPRATSNSIFVRVDRAANTVTYDPEVQRPKPLDPQDRETALERASANGWPR